MQPLPAVAVASGSLAHGIPAALGPSGNAASRHSQSLNVMWQHPADAAILPRVLAMSDAVIQPLCLLCLTASAKRHSRQLAASDLLGFPLAVPALFPGNRPAVAWPGPLPGAVRGSQPQVVPGALLYHEPLALARQLQLSLDARAPRANARSHQVAAVQFPAPSLPLVPAVSSVSPVPDVLPQPVQSSSGSTAPLGRAGFASRLYAAVRN
mmetsp:Transcript_131610/g.262634  ORF Transcript_131610/g.262634 Transcript_131610/m.262634 type:complete len:210 (-) Transcript_131610:784-1413(-)